MSRMQSKDLNTVSFKMGKWERRLASVIAEQAVTLTVNNEPWLTFMCTPLDLEAMAVGFLFNEEIIDSMAEVASVYVCPTGDNVDVWLSRAVQKPDKWARTSGCSGGTTSVGKNETRGKRVNRKNGLLLTAEKVGDLINQLGKVQELYRKSGGVHTSAMSDGEKIVLVAEDIGRHNTLDKLAGHYLMVGLNLNRKIILTTGRVSSEMIQKAGRLGAKVVISRTSPTTLSVQMAERMNITLVGYARGDRFTIYAHDERIMSISQDEKIIVRQHDQ